VFRSTTGSDLGAVLSFSSPGPGPWVDALQFLAGQDSGNYRDEWTWLAFLDGRPLARGIWWGPAHSAHPTRLDCLLVDPSVPHPEVWSGALERSATRAFIEAGAPMLPEEGHVPRPALISARRL